MKKKEKKCIQRVSSWPMASLRAVGTWAKGLEISKPRLKVETGLVSGAQVNPRRSLLGCLVRPAFLHSLCLRVVSTLTFLFYQSFITSLSYFFIAYSIVCCGATLLQPDRLPRAFFTNSQIP